MGQEQEQQTNNTTTKPVTIEEITRDIHQTKILGEYIDILIKKKKGFLRAKLELAQFKEPVLWLIRRDLSVQFFENIRQSKYKFEHSDPEIGEIETTLNPSKLLRFSYGSNEFRGYILFEDEYLPYPNHPLLDAETVKIQYDKMLNDIRKWKAEERKAIGEMWLKIFLGIGALGVVYVLYKMLVPTPAQSPAVEQQVVKNVTQNLTNAIQGATIIG